MTTLDAIMYLNNLKNWAFLPEGNEEKCKEALDTAIKALIYKNGPMSADYYQELALRTCIFSPDDELERNRMMSHAIFGLCSEAGEVAGIFQKVYQGHKFDEEHLKEELGDCLWMISEAACAFGMDLSDIMKANIFKLEERYPDGFDSERSKHRKEGDNR